MKEATGEVSMTVITLVAIGVIGGLLALFWGPLKNTITSIFTNSSNCPAGQYYDYDAGACKKPGE